MDPNRTYGSEVSISDCFSFHVTEEEEEEGEEEKEDSAGGGGQRLVSRDKLSAAAMADKWFSHPIFNRCDGNGNGLG